MGYGLDELGRSMLRRLVGTVAAFVQVSQSPPAPAAAVILYCADASPEFNSIHPEMEAERLLGDNYIGS